MRIKVEINTEALKANLAHIKEKAPGSGIVAVLKADAYGHGMHNIMDAKLDIDVLAVASIEEAVILRDYGYQGRLLCLSALLDKKELSIAQGYNLELVIFSFQQIELLKQIDRHSLKYWLKVNTGMNRLGFSISEFKSAYQALTQLKHANDTLVVMTHFSEAENQVSSTTQDQAELFFKAVSGLDVELSLANSAALLRDSNYQKQWVRPGILLYGVSPYPWPNRTLTQLRPVMTLSSVLIDKKVCKSGHAIGYGGEFVCQQDMVIGVVAIGYGDGYPRHASTGTPVLINGVRCPIVGRVSMDMITVDLSNCLDAKIGETVILWGEQLSVEEIAFHSETIAYELLCNVGSRLRMKKVLVDE